MPTRNINLTDALERFVAAFIASGKFQNALEVVRAGLRLLKAEEETRTRKLEALRAAVQESLDHVAARRDFEVDDSDAYFDEIDREIEPEFDAEDAAARSPAE